VWTSSHLADIAGDISFASHLIQEYDPISHNGNKNQQESGIFVVNHTNCYELGQDLLVFV